MSRRRTTAFVVAAAIAVSCVGVVWAQRRGGEGGRRGGGRYDPAVMRERMMARMQQTLGSTDEEWEVIGPLVETVMTVSEDTGGGLNMRRMFGRRGPRAGTPPVVAGEEDTRSETRKAADALQTVLDDEGSTPDDVTASLTAYREARDKAREELAEARKALQEAVNVRQEGQLVLMGMLD